MIPCDFIVLHRGWSMPKTCGEKSLEKSLGDAFIRFIRFQLSYCSGKLPNLMATTLLLFPKWLFHRYVRKLKPAPAFSYPFLESCVQIYMMHATFCNSISPDWNWKTLFWIQRFFSYLILRLNMYYCALSYGSIQVTTCYGEPSFHLSICDQTKYLV